MQAENSIYKNIVEPKSKQFLRSQLIAIKDSLDLDYLNSLIIEVNNFLIENKDNYKLTEYLSMAVLAYEKDEEPMYGVRKFNAESRASLMWLFSYIIEYINPYKYPFIGNEKRDNMLLGNLKKWREEHYPVLNNPLYK